MFRLRGSPHLSPELTGYIRIEGSVKEISVFSFTIRNSQLIIVNGELRMVNCERSESTRQRKDPGLSIKGHLKGLKEIRLS